MIVPFGDFGGFFFAGCSCIDEKLPNIAVPDDMVVLVVLVCWIVQSVRVSLCVWLCADNISCVFDSK